MPVPPAPVAEPALAFCDHDHDRCSDALLADADALTEERGARLTPVRRRVLEILLEEHRALGAYEVLERLVKDGFGNQPPVAYRALDFLVEQGLAHRISRLNAFMACMQPGKDHSPAFFICERCNSVAEAPGQAIGQAVAGAAACIGFAAKRVTVEVLGICPSCAESQP
jgi:Fur family transcriptional regulator, zinc uptake regulator